MNPFQSLAEYERLIYTLAQQFGSIRSSTLVLARRGQGLATLSGDLFFESGYRLAVYELLTWDTGSLFIQNYSYEVWQNAEKAYWYDPQPHPNDPDLAATHPHHKHVPPDIKHHRIPAPGLRFDGPNLPLLIEEIEKRLRLSIP